MATKMIVTPAVGGIQFKEVEVSQPLAVGEQEVHTSGNKDRPIGQDANSSVVVVKAQHIGTALPTTNIVGGVTIGLNEDIYFQDTVNDVNSGIYEVKSLAPLTWGRAEYSLHPAFRENYKMLLVGKGSGTKMYEMPFSAGYKPGFDAFGLKILADMQTKPERLAEMMEELGLGANTIFVKEVKENLGTVNIINLQQGDKVQFDVHTGGNNTIYSYIGTEITPIEQRTATNWVKASLAKVTLFRFLADEMEMYLYQAGTPLGAPTRFLTKEEIEERGVKLAQQSRVYLLKKDVPNDAAIALFFSEIGAGKHVHLAQGYAGILGSGGKVMTYMKKEIPTSIVATDWQQRPSEQKYNFVDALGNIEQLYHKDGLPLKLLAIYNRVEEKITDSVQRLYQETSTFKKGTGYSVTPATEVPALKAKAIAEGITIIVKLQSGDMAEISSLGQLTSVSDSTVALTDAGGVAATASTKSIKFDGIDDSMTVTHHPSIDANDIVISNGIGWGISFHIKFPIGMPDNEYTIVSKGFPDAGNTQFLGYFVQFSAFSPGGYNIRYGFSAGARIIDRTSLLGGIPFTGTGWHHIKLYFTGLKGLGQMNITIDSIVQPITNVGNENPLGSVAATGIKDLLIGINQTGSTAKPQYFLDNLLIWSGADIPVTNLVDGVKPRDLTSLLATIDGRLYLKLGENGVADTSPILKTVIINNSDVATITSTDVSA